LVFQLQLQQLIQLQLSLQLQQLFGIGDRRKDRN
jgi:hypothetical protein